MYWLCINKFLIPPLLYLYVLSFCFQMIKSSACRKLILIFANSKHKAQRNEGPSHFTYH